VLFADVDGTLTGDAEALNTFNHHWISVQAPRGSVLVYNTARPLEGTTGTGYWSLVESHRHREPGQAHSFITPDVMITGEGTNIRWVDSTTPGKGVLDPEWDAIMASKWDGKRVAAELLPTDEKAIKIDLNGDDKYRLAATYGSKERADTACATVKKALGDNYTVEVTPGWIPNVWIVGCRPARGGKGKAAEFVRQRLAISPDRCVWAGDSDNDLDVLTTPFLGIVVGNCISERLAQAAAESSTIFGASAHSAGGILDGLEYHGFA